MTGNLHCLIRNVMNLFNKIFPRAVFLMIYRHLFIICDTMLDSLFTPTGTKFHSLQLAQEYVKPRKSRKRILIIIAILVVVFIIALAVGLSLRSKNKSDDTPSEAGQEGTETPSSTVTPNPESSWLALPCASQRSLPACPWSKNPLVLVSLDGFRADYFLRNHTPVIQKLQSCGVHTPYMRAVYPTLTFPNHYSIVTGMYPESHGIVANRMYDVDINATFTLYNEEKFNPDWYGGEPLWVTAKKQGKRTAAFFWVGSDVNISGVYPDYWYSYDGSITYQKRVNQTMEWLLLPDEERPEMIAVYFNQPDSQGHNSGPDSPEVTDMLGTMDAIVGQLMDSLLQHNLDHCVNLIITSDHGMTAQSCDQSVLIQDYTTAVADMQMFYGSYATLFPHLTIEESGVTSVRNEAVDIDTLVRNLTCKNSNMNVFTKATLPKRHHYTNSERIGDVLIDMANGWRVFKNELGFCTGGNHGWDEMNEDMHTIFLAHGPAFKENFSAEPFELIELYNMMCDVLDITPSPNNGTVGSLNSMLKTPKPIVISSHTQYGSCTNGLATLPTCNCVSDNAVPSAGILRVDNDDIMVLGYPYTNLSMCTLHQTGFSTGYSPYLTAPIWATAILTETQNASDWLATSSCLLQDTRTPGDCPNPIVNDNITLTSLVGQGFLANGERASVSSSVVPVYHGFKNEIWRPFLDLLNDYATTYGSFLVTAGPVYNYNNDGLYEGKTDKTKYADSENTMPIPTDIYAMIIKCKDKVEQLPCDDDVDVLSFILPHLQAVPNCMTMNKYLRDNVVRIRDIELLTGIKFMTGVQAATAIRLRTFLPEHIWPSTLFTQ